MTVQTLINLMISSWQLNISGILFGRSLVSALALDRCLYENHYCPL